MLRISQWLLQAAILARQQRSHGQRKVHSGVRRLHQVQRASQLEGSHLEASGMAQEWQDWDSTKRPLTPTASSSSSLQQQRLSQQVLPTAWASHVNQSLQAGSLRGYLRGKHSRSLPVTSGGLRTTKDGESSARISGGFIRRRRWCKGKSLSISSCKRGRGTQSHRRRRLVMRPRRRGRLRHQQSPRIPPH